MIYALPALLLRFDVDPVLKRQGTHQVLPKDRLSDLPENMRDEPDVVIVRRRRSPDLRFPLVCPGSLEPFSCVLGLGHPAAFERGAQEYARMSPTKIPYTTSHSLLERHESIAP